MNPARQPRSGLRHNRDWRKLWLGQAVSLVGDSMFDITMLLWVATVIARGRPWAPAAATGVLMAAAVPVLAVGPVAGVFVDRWNRRRTMLAADAFRLVLIISVLAVPAIGHAFGTGPELTAVYLAVGLESGAAQFFNPSRLAIMGRIVSTPGDRAKASGLLQATGSLAAIIGPPAAAPLFFASGARWALIADALSFAGSLAAIAAMRVPEAGRPEAAGLDPAGTALAAAPPAGFRQEFLAGARFFASSRVLVALCGGVVITTLGTGALNALEVFFVTGNLHTAARWLGVVYAATGAGAVLGALLGGWAAARIGAARVFYLGLIGGGIVLGAFSRLGQFSVAVAVVALAGLMFGAINAAVPPLFLAVIPQQLIGRVMAIFNPLQQLAGLTSMALAGFLASTALRSLHADIAGVTFGPMDTIFGFSALLITVAGFAVIVPLRGGSARSPEVPGGCSPEIHAGLGYDDLSR
jgi:MFS family permease